jgi:hypothetical protein
MNFKNWTDKRLDYERERVIRTINRYKARGYVSAQERLKVRLKAIFQEQRSREESR